MLNLPTFVITQRDAQERQEHIRKIFAKRDWPVTFVDGVSGYPGWLGCALAHEKMLRSAPEPPFLVLEDDVEFSSETAVIPDVPEGADLFFPGISRGGCVQDLGHYGVYNLALATRYQGNVARLWSMTSAHAVMYCSDAGVDMVREAIQRAKTVGRPFDIFLAYMLPRLNCYGVVRPVFQQSSALQGKRRVARVARRFTQRRLPLAHDGERREVSFRGQTAVCCCDIDTDGAARWVVESLARDQN